MRKWDVATGNSTLVYNFNVKANKIMFYITITKALVPKDNYLMASMKFDLPEPFGPMTAVKGRIGPSRRNPLYDLKFSSSMYLSCAVGDMARDEKICQRNVRKVV